MRKKTSAEFIAQAQAVHGDLYDYSQVEYKSANTKVLIIDPEYGEFEITPSNHLAGKGHTLRSKRPKYTTESFIDAAKKIHNNLYMYDKTDYSDSRTKVCVTDRDFGDFWVTPNNHLRGKGHPERGRERAAKASRKRGVSKSAFLARSRLKHNNLYDYSLMDYKNTSKKIKIIDPIYGVFEQTPKKHMTGQGHPMRARQKTCDSLRSNRDEFVKKAKLVHGDFYDYSMVEYKNNKTPVTIIDPEFGEFKQAPSTHLSGSGSPFRKGQKITQAKSSSTDEFIQKAIAVHGNMYDYSKVDYVSAKTPVVIIDPQFGEFNKSPDKHLRGQGHPSRGYQRIAESMKSNTDEFIAKSKLVHGALYNYSKVDYISAKTPVVIIDPDFGEFYQLPDGHLAGHGHPLRGIESARKIRSLPVSEFIARANDIHGGIYDYSKVNYSSVNDKITIIDPEYGEFEQTAASHMGGCGCPARAEYGFDPSKPGDTLLSQSM